MPVSGREFCRLLKKNGWHLKRIRGSHHLYAKDGRERMVVVPVHANKPMHKSMLSRLEKDSGVKAR